MSVLICSECKGATVNRSRRRSAFDYLLAIFGIYPYRCSSCMHRFRSFGLSRKRDAAAEKEIEEPS